MPFFFSLNIQTVELFDCDFQRLTVSRLVTFLCSNQIKLTLNLEHFSLANLSKDRFSLYKGQLSPQTLKRYLIKEVL